MFNLLNGVIFLIALVPPSPKLMDRLKSTGELDRVIKTLKDARDRGVDSPDFKRLESLRNRIRDKRLEKSQLTVPSIVLLTDFDDNEASTPASHYDSLLFLYTGGQETMRDFYMENSYGVLDVQGYSSGWYRMPHEYTYYSQNNGFGSFPNNAQGLVRDAVLAADPYVDFSELDGDGDGYVDALFVVHAGPGAEETGNPNHIWSHRWVLPYPLQVDGVYVYDYSMEPENGKIGVFSHELGHVFGLPDLYDYGYDSEGLGNWSVMAGGSWGNGGRTPVHFDAWCKYELGFVDPVVVSSTLEDAPVPRVEDSSVAYLLWTGGGGGPQYFLVENRRKVKFDAYLPSEGLLIFHVDESQSGNNNQWYPGHTGSGHYKVALEQADAQWDLEQNVNSGDSGDPYPGTSNNRRFDNSSWPDSRNYSFQFTHVAVSNISGPGDVMTADFSVKPVPNLALREIVAPQGVTFEDSSITPEVVVGNFGEGDMAPQVALQIWNGDSLIYSDEKEGGQISPGDSISLTFSPFTPQESLLYRVLAYSHNPEDGYPIDDTIKTTFIVFTVDRDILLSEAGSEIQVDGILEDTEWEDAQVIEITDLLNNGGGELPDPGTATMLIKHSGEALDLGFRLQLGGVGLNVARLSMFFDDNASGSYPEPGDNSEGELYIFLSSQNTNAYFRPLYNSGGASASQVPLNFATKSSDTLLTVELEVPFEYYPVAEDWAISAAPPVDTFGLFISFKVLNPNLGALAWYPQDIASGDYLLPELYASVEVHGIEVGVGERVLQHGEGLNPVVRVSSLGALLFLNSTYQGPLSLQVFSATGRSLWRTKLRVSGYSSRGIRLGTGDLPSGVYFLKIQGDGISKIVRFPVIR